MDLFIRLLDPEDADGPALDAHIEVGAVKADVSRIGNAGIAVILTTDEVPHELQVVGEEVDAMLVVVHHEEMTFVDAEQGHRTFQILLITSASVLTR